jgi:hypothetical protein
LKIKNHQVLCHAYSNISFRDEFYIFYSLKFEDHELFAGQGPKPTQATTKASSANPTAQKPAAYRPPHAKTAAAIQAEVHIHRINDPSLFLF